MRFIAKHIFDKSKMIKDNNNDKNNRNLDLTRALEIQSGVSFLWMKKLRPGGQ